MVKLQTTEKIQFKINKLKLLKSVTNYGSWNYFDKRKQYNDISAFTFFMDFFSI